MTPSEMAGRLRHDLIKHLDIPESGHVLTDAEAGVLLRRVFDSAHGMCRAALMLGFKLRRDPDWETDLEVPLSQIERRCSAFSERESDLRRRLFAGGVMPDDDIAALRDIVDAVHQFETASQALMRDGGVDDSALAMDFFGFSADPVSDSVLEPDAFVPADEKEPPVEKMRVLVVDDHLMLIDRLQAHPAFIRRFTWATLCSRSCECLACPERGHCEKRRARTAREAERALEKAEARNLRVDAILMDVRFDDLTGDELLRLPNQPALNTEERIKSLQGLIIARHLHSIRAYAGIPIVLMTARSRLPDGANSLLNDMEGLQYVDDDDTLDALASRIESLIRLGREVPVEQGYFWGTSPRVQMARRQIEIMSQGPRTVFITGPSGSGKSSLVEKIIYPLSGRKPLITLDLSSIPDTLVESELFGHVKGAYSGAATDRMGLIEEADGGLLFLDEIGNLASEIQRKLLLFLQDKMVRRVGAPHNTARRVDVKVIVATHIDLEQEVKAGRFRFDLYMRFGPAMRISLPSLSDRLDDMPAFIEMLIHKILNGTDMKPYVEDFRKRNGTSGEMRVDFSRNYAGLGENEACVRFRPATRELFMSYGWPGNTRELESVLDTLILKAFYDLRITDSQSRIIEIDPYYALSLIGGIDRSAEMPSLTESDVGPDLSGKWPEIGIVADFSELRRTLEARYLCSIYSECAGDLGRMGARLFGDDSESVRHKILVRMNQLGISIRRLKKNI